MNQYYFCRRFKLLVYCILLPITFHVLPPDTSGIPPVQPTQPPTLPGFVTPSKRARPGPKVTPINERKAAKTTPGEPRGSYTREKKLQVIRWLQDERNYRRLESKDNTRCRDGLVMISERRPPTNKEAEAYWHIDGDLIAKWWRKRDKTLCQPGGSRRDRRDVQTLHYPRLEAELYRLFVNARAKGEPIGQGWFKREASKLHKSYYPDDIYCFKISRGWFSRFLKRWQITRRRITKQSTKTPEQEYNVVNSFLRFIRRVSKSLTSTTSTRFSLDRIMNMDETPIPFEYLDGYTYTHKGSKTVSVRTLRSGWGKRQATLILYIFADGIKRLPPKLIFHGVEGGEIEDRESHLYDQRVT
jgi:hypothetical protein